ncbi:MAG: siderophore ABC transporter substrate-binding protein [Eubacteriales bacterium]|nr:siderophore ABC transporter substrate-binding protein [Eubacteriales bacterium]
MKKLVTLAISLIMATSLFGCGNSSDKNTDASADAVQSQETTTEETNAEEGDTLVNNETEVLIEHSKGKVVVPKNPKKIAVFDFGILDTIDTLGIDVEMALPIDSIPQYLESYKENTTNAGGIKEPNIEELFNFEPEVIFISGRQADFYDELSKIAPTVYVELDGANYIASIQYNTAILTEIFQGKEDVSEEKLINIAKRVEEVNQKASATEEKALVILTNSGKMSTYGRGSRFGIIFDDLGVKPADENIEVSTHGKEISYEYIAEINPDIIFVIDRNAVVGGENDDSQILNNELVNGTNAAKSGKIINLDPEIWYIAGGGLTSVNTMIEEVEKAFN